MFARGARLAIAAARRQLKVPATPFAPNWTSASPLCMRRDNARSMTTEVVGCPANEERRRLLNRILYRSRQRGYLELDLLLGTWATDNIEQLDDKGLGALVEVLEEENPDLLSWITGQVEAPENIAKNPVFSAIHKQVSDRLNEHSSTETRAQPGQPWVRGWDDNRKKRFVLLAMEEGLLEKFRCWPALFISTYILHDFNFAAAIIWKNANNLPLGVPLLQLNLSDRRIILRDWM